MQIEIPDNIDRFHLDYDSFRKCWNAWAIIDKEVLIDGIKSKELKLWYKGTGSSPELACKELCANFLAGKDLGELQKPTVLKDGKGYRTLEKLEAQRQANMKPLEEFF